jgi:hypothetical protein
LSTLTLSDNNVALATLAAAGGSGPIDLIKTPEPTHEVDARFSPDGKFFAYGGSAV